MIYMIEDLEQVIWLLTQFAKIASPQHTNCQKSSREIYFTEEKKQESKSRKNERLQ